MIDLPVAPVMFVVAHVKSGIEVQICNFLSCNLYILFVDVDGQGSDDYNKLTATLEYSF